MAGKITNIKHNPIFDTKKVCEFYSKKDGVPVSYVCTTALDDGGELTFAKDIYYRETPHPEFGNRYFCLYNSLISGHMMIGNADAAEKLEFGLVEDDEGNLQYSCHRHDYKAFNNGNMIDGGRAYIRSSGCHVYIYIVKDGKFVPINEEGE